MFGPSQDRGQEPETDPVLVQHLPRHGLNVLTHGGELAPADHGSTLSESIPIRKPL